MKKGITIITLIIMVVVMIILTTTVTITGVQALNNSKKLKFASELVFMQETIDNYSKENSGYLPITGSEITNSNLPEGQYYEIDTSLLGIIETTYGRKLNNDTNDIYVISKADNKVYYLKGLKIGNKVYFTLDDELKNIINYTDTKIVSKDGIIFTPSITNYTNQAINVKVQIPLEYSEVSVLSQNVPITEFTSENNYSIYNISKSSNYDIVVNYSKDGESLKQVYTISNYDNEVPSIEIIDTTTLNNNEEIKTSITISTSDNLSGVSKVLYEVDNVEKTYFETENKGKKVTNNNVIVDKYTKYITFYIVDKAGNSKILLKELNPTVTENDYAKYGLILHYDAINNTGNGHSDNTTIWKDLSGNGNNGVLFNFDNTQTSGWNGNYLTLDGIDDLVSVYMPISGQNCTIEITAKFISGKYMLRSDAGIRTYIYNTYAMKGYPTYKTIIYNNYEDKISTRVLRYYTKSNISKFNCYYNGIGSDELEFEGTNDGTFLSIGSFLPNEPSEPGAEKVYSVRVYNRALTEEEIKQNYNIDKIRFGI